MNLQDNLELHFRLTPLQKQGLKKLHISTIEELLRYYPLRYGDTSKAKSISNISKGENVSIFGIIKNLETKKGFKSKIPMARAKLEDSSGSIGIVWFNQPYLAKIVREGAKVRVEGKVSEGKSGAYISNPKIEEISEIPQISRESLFVGEEAPSILYPVYSETRHISSSWIFHHIQKIFKSGILENMEDPIPNEILEKYSLPSLKTSFVWMHSPQKSEHFEMARKRFSFEEVFMIQLDKQIERAKLSKMKSIKVENAEETAKEFIETLPFPLTNAQQKSISTIIKEMKSGIPMSRLLEGDVGSGKTAVAATTSYAVINAKRDMLAEEKGFGNLQVAYMAPTEILASQHFESFTKYFKHLPIEMALITGSTCKKFPSKINPDKSTDVSKSQMLKWIEEGKISLVIGTHALIQKKVKFKNLAYAIIDEQHRFGVSQRQKLARKDGVVPHLLSMTATPIPRTLALTIYGDLDLSILDEMPEGRKKIITEISLPTERSKVYEKIREEIKMGRQAYIICPRIDEPDPDKEKAIIAKSVKEEAKRLKEKIFREFTIDIMHSKMSPKEKDAVMHRFSEGKIDILVSTSVVEVGVNVPNATLIIIEGGERFGLSQLHQLRGRVLRGEHQPYCFVFAETKSDKSLERLRAFKTAKNGFELSELDMMQRGAGELSNGKQWGVSDIAMEALRNIKMVEAAREEAKIIAKKNPDLTKFPLLKSSFEKRTKTHFE